MNRRVVFCYKILVDCRYVGCCQPYCLGLIHERVGQDAECGIQLISDTLTKGLHYSHRAANGLCT